MRKAKIKFGLSFKETGLCKTCENVVPDKIYYNLCKYFEGVGTHLPIIECDCYKKGKIKMIEGKELLEFATEMIKVLNEKAEKYEKNNKYGDITEEWIFQKIENQLEKYIKLPVWKRNDKEYTEYKKRRLIHVANFVFLLYNKLL